MMEGLGGVAMNVLTIAALSAALSAAPASAQDASARWDARVTAVTGEATIHPADGSPESPAAEGAPLEEGDRVTTAPGATVDLSLDGGSLIAIAENSDFTLEKTAKSESVFALAFGSLMAKIQKLGDQRLSVRTANSVAAVRGTEFGVDAVQGGASRVGVFDEGRVEVSGGGGMEVLTPNQETSVAPGAKPRKAAPLKRFLARRAAMRAQVARLEGVRRGWTSLDAEKRREVRRQIFERERARRRERQNRRPNRRAPR